jgi:hypothetical protein
VLPYAAADDAAQFERWFLQNESLVRFELREAILETALMAVRQLYPPTGDTAPAQIGRELAHVVCNDCRKTDRVMSQEADRIWIQPIDNPRALRSLPWRQ